MGRNFEDLEHDSGEEKLTAPQKLRAKAILLLQKKKNKMVKRPPKKSEPRPAGVIRKIIGKLSDVPPDEDSSFCGMDGKVWDSMDSEEDD